MKQPWEWTEEDLQGLITNRVQESVVLDYKQSPALSKSDEKKKNEISKDVSALANSAGGTIVYGMAENGHVPTHLDGGYDPSDITKEWLEQIINSRIQRRVDGVRINQVELTTTNPGRVAYVVYVPQSMRAPHQASDKRFYKRFNFESVPMEEYEVRDASRRFESPDLQLRFTVETTPAPNTIRLRSVLSNDAPTPAQHIVIAVLIDSRLTVRCIDQRMRASGPRSWRIGNADVELQEYVMSYGSDNLPVFHGVTFGVPEPPFQVTLPPRAGRFGLVWGLRSPRMPEKKGGYWLVSDGASVQLEPVE